jgi:hypothetical protein
MKGAATLVATFMLAAGAAHAKTGTPGPDYFAGSYDMVGRSAKGGFSGPAQIVAQGKIVVIQSCNLPDVHMGFGPAYEVVNLMTGTLAGDTVECLFHNNGYNRPILTCLTDTGGAFTLWPLAAAPLQSC